MKIRSLMFCVSAVISLILIASPASAIHLDDANLEADCEKFCITVEGRAFAQDPCIIEYELGIDKPHAPIEGSFDVPIVVGDVGTWDVFAATSCVDFHDICGEYTITGTARLICESDPENIQSLPLGPTDIVCPCEEEGDEGCTPGFWKNHPDCWCTEYQPETLVGDVWIIPDELSKLANKTLLQALQGGGGPGAMGAAKILLRAATASLQNACNGDVSFPLSVQNIIDEGNAALATLKRKKILQLARTLDDLNNLGCPINAKCMPEMEEEY